MRGICFFTQARCGGPAGLRRNRFWTAMPLRTWLLNTGLAGPGDREESNMESLWQDIKYGVRMLLKAPSFSIIATIALALGIGANTAIFSVVNAVLLQPLPFSNPEQLLAIWETDQQRGLQQGTYSYPNFFDLRAQNHVFERIAAHHNADFIMTGRGEPARLLGAVVTADLFPLLGTTPMIGRGFRPDEDKLGEGGRVVVLSQELF